MTTVTQRLMSGLGQAGSDWTWSWTVSIHDTSYEPDPIVVSSITEQVTEEQETEDQDTHDNSSGTSDL